MQHWLKGHLFQLGDDGSVDLFGRQVTFIYNSLLRCREKACPQRGGFFFSENFQKHIESHKDGASPGELLQGIEEREANKLDAKGSL
jgi:hypothetical protein